jgi:two-component system response regulator HupR/HoxA
MENRTVLFVDDDTIIRMALERDLKDEPYNKLFAKTGEEALKIVQEKEVHVIVTDMRMPGIGGLELLRIVKEGYPNIIRLVLSGYMQPTTLLTAINDGEVFRYITKPWKEEGQLKRIIREAIDLYNLQNDRYALIAESSEHKNQDDKTSE